MFHFVEVNGNMTIDTWFEFLSQMATGLPATTVHPQIPGLFLVIFPNSQSHNKWIWLIIPHAQVNDPVSSNEVSHLSWRKNIIARASRDNRPAVSWYRNQYFMLSDCRLRGGVFIGGVFRSDSVMDFSIAPGVELQVQKVASNIEFLCQFRTKNYQELTCCGTASQCGSQSCHGVTKRSQVCVTSRLVLRDWL